VFITKFPVTLAYIHVKWVVKPSGRGHFFRSLHDGRYLAVELGAVDGVCIIASPYPLSWAVKPVNSAA
jgi:hypothetical protein